MRRLFRIIAEFAELAIVLVLAFVLCALWLA